MNIRARVRSLEESREPGRCTFCHGRGYSGVLIWDGGLRPEPTGCPQCGRIAEHIKMIILNDGTEEAACR